MTRAEQKRMAAVFKMLSSQNETTTAFRRKQALSDITDRQREVVDGIRRFHMNDAKSIPPTRFFTESQFIGAVAGAFICGVGFTLALIWMMAA